MRAAATTFLLLFVGLSSAATLQRTAGGAALEAQQIDAISKAKSAIQQGSAQIKTLSSERAQFCKQELTATSAWLSEGNSLDASGRTADKQNLQQALADRVSNLNKFLEKLRAIRSKLGEHITRVNKLFKAKYKMGLNDQLNAAAILRDLGMVLSTPHNPSLNPIKMPQSGIAAPISLESTPITESATTKESPSSAADSAETSSTSTAATGAATGAAQPPAANSSSEAEDDIDSASASETAAAANATKAAAANATATATADATPAATGNSTDNSTARFSLRQHSPRQSRRSAHSDRALTALVEESSRRQMASLHVQVASAMGNCKAEGCAAAYGKAFQLYRSGGAHMTRNKADFERERAALAAFRDGLDALVKRKKGKLAGLTAQLAQLNKALGKAEGAFSTLWPRIRKHQAIISSSCAAANTETQVNGALRSEVLAILNGSPAAAAAAADSAPSTDASAADASASPAADAAESSADTPAAAAATGGAKKAGVLEEPVAATGSSAAPEAPGPDTGTIQGTAV